MAQFTIAGRSPAVSLRTIARVAAAVAFVAVGVLMVVRPDAEWAQVFVLASRQLTIGEDIYHTGTLYLYPPFGTILGLPFVPLPEWATRLTFYVLNVACVGVIAVVSWRMAGGGALGEPSRETRKAWIVVAIGVAVGAPYAWNTILHQQADLLIGAFVALGMAAMLGGRSVAAGVLIGLGASIKGPPLLFLVYFLWRRDARASLALVATVAIAALLPDLVHHAPEGTWIGLWLKRVVLPAADMNATLGAWATGADYNIYNQSLAGTLQRLINTRFTLDGGDVSILSRNGVVAAHSLKMISYAVMAAMGLATFAVSARAAMRRKTLTERSVACEREARAIELAIVPLLMLAFSLMSGLAHFPIVTPAVVLLARRAVYADDRAARFSVAVAVIVAIAVNKDLVGRIAYDFFLWSGVPTLGLLALWTGSLFVLGRPDPTPIGPGASGGSPVAKVGLSP